MSERSIVQSKLWKSYKKLLAENAKLKQKPPKTKRQFSKTHVIFANALVSAVWVAYIILAWCEKPFASDLPITIVTIYGGFATGGYFAQNMVRDTSANKLRAELHDADIEL